MEIKLRLSFLLIFIIFFQNLSYAQDFGRKLCYEINLSQDKKNNSEDDLPWYFSYLLKNKSYRLTFICYKNEAIGYTNNDEDEKIESVKEMGDFTLRINNEELFYSIMDNDTYVVKKTEIKNINQYTVSENVKYNNQDCKKIYNKKNPADFLILFDKYPSQWGCQIFKNTKFCVLESSQKSIRISLVKDEIIDSNYAKKILREAKKIPFKITETKSPIISAAKGIIKPDFPFPNYSLRDIKNNIVSSNENIGTIKLFIFWRNNFAYIPQEIRNKMRSHSLMLKEFNTIASKKIKIHACYLDDFDSLQEYIPNVESFNKINILCNCSDWALNYLNIKTFITIVATKDGKTILREHYDNNTHDIEDILEKLKPYL